MARVFENYRLLVKDIHRDIERGMKGLTLEITANLRRPKNEGGTPVDTGWARANWIPEVGDPFEGTAGTRAEAEQGVLDPSPHKSGVANVLRYKLFKKIWITNNVPYIVLCNTLPTHNPLFVEGSIKEALTALERGLFTR